MRFLSKTQQVLCGCLLILSISVGAAEPITDLRVLVDVSGSMKQNDPAYLRQPALRLLTNLLPKKSQAGV